jgi:hypothetical protein
VAEARSHARRGTGGGAHQGGGGSRNLGVSRPVREPGSGSAKASWPPRNTSVWEDRDELRVHKTLGYRHAFGRLLGNLGHGRLVPRRLVAASADYLI